MRKFSDISNSMKKGVESLPRVDAAEIRLQLSAWAGKVRQADIKKLIRDQFQIERLFGRENYLMPFIEDSRTMLRLVKDYAVGGYKNVPWKTIAAIVGGIGYVLSPFDLIPDVIPVFGFFDDASLVKILASAVAADVEKYRQWVKANETAYRIANERHVRMIRIVGWSILVSLVFAAIGVRFFGRIAASEVSVWSDAIVTVLHVFEGVLGLAFIGSMSYILVFDFERRYHKWLAFNPPQIYSSVMPEIRQAFAFWRWALFGWIGATVRTPRHSAYLTIAKAAIRHPRAAWALAREVWNLKHPKKIRNTVPDVGA